MSNNDSRYPKISVIMAVHRTARSYLEQAILSVLNQTHSDLELIIINDGSGPNTLSLLDLWAKRDRRISIINIVDNIGLTRALNYGITFARGEFIARQDADDISLDSRFEKQLRILEQDRNVILVATCSTIIDRNGLQAGILRVDPSLKHIQKYNVLVHGTIMFRKDCFPLLPVYDERMYYAQDYELYLRIINKKLGKIFVLNEPLYELRRHPDSISSRRLFAQTYYAALAKAVQSDSRYGSFRFQYLFALRLVYEFLVIRKAFLGYCLRWLSRHKAS